MSLVRLIGKVSIQGETRLFLANGLAYTLGAEAALEEGIYRIVGSPDSSELQVEYAKKLSGFDLEAYERAAKALE